MLIAFENEYALEKLDESFLKDKVEFVIQQASRELDLSNDLQVDILVSDEALMHHLNMKWFQKDRPTNVLSFPLNDFDKNENIESQHLGDIVIGYDVVVKEAQRDNKKEMHHFLHLILHGFLHLLGYTHDQDRDAEIMETLEIKILEKCGIENPYEYEGVK